MTTSTVEKKGFLYPAMFRGLIEAAIFTNEERLCEEAQVDYNHQYAYRGDWEIGKSSLSISDFAPSAIAYLEDVCRNFEAQFSEFCLAAGNYLLKQLNDHTELEYVGHDLWMTICGHGCGFWDGDWEEPIASELSEWCRKHGDIELYVGSDGLVYVFGKENYAS